MRILRTTLLTAAALSAGDLSGKWTGTAQVGNENGEAYLELNQQGNAITGKAGPAEDKTAPIQNASFDGKKLAFTITVPSEGRVLQFDLRLAADDRLEGSVAGENSNGEKFTGTISVTRAAAQVDVSGAWTGPLELAAENGESFKSEALCTFRQAGAGVTGSCGNADEDGQASVRNWKLAGSRLAFDLENGDGRVFKITGTLSGDKIVGEIEGATPDGSKVKGKLSLSRRAS